MEGGLRRTPSSAVRCRIGLKGFFQALEQLMNREEGTLSSPTLERRSSKAAKIREMNRAAVMRKLFGTTRVNPERLCGAVKRMLPQECLQGHSVVRVLGAGKFGLVLLVRNDATLKHSALKLVRVTPRLWITPEDEMERQRVFAALGLAPAVQCFETYASGSFRYAALMMDRLDATLEQFLFQEEYAPTPQQLQDVEDGLFALWRKMEASGVTHGDMHAGNVGLKALPDGRLKLFLLDFGRASTQVSNLPIDMSHFIYSLVSQSGGGATRKWALQLKKKMNAFLQRRGVRSIVGRPSEYDRLRKPYEDAYLVIEDD
jgi:hypothetical protein